MTIAEQIMQLLKGAGVRRMFGMPGGGSNADLIEAAAKFAIPFSLAHSETASAMMAIAQAEVTGHPGVCIATLGPGAASIMNGIAQAYLDRVPLLVITDCHPQALRHMQHQALCHTAMFSPVTKFSAEVSLENAYDVLSNAIEALLKAPPGPVHIDISAQVTSSTTSGQFRGPNPRSPTGNAGPSEIPLQVQDLLRQMRRPLFLIGLAARTKDISAALKTFCDRSGIPALVTYKAKGVVPDHQRWFAGLLTNGALEREILKRADCFIALGLDPVELLPVPWRYSQPVISVSPWHIEQQQIPVAIELVGDVLEWLKILASSLPAESDWSPSEVAEFLQAQRAAMRPPNQDGKLAPHRVVELTADVYRGVRVTVDAGAHMFPVMSFWPANEPCDVLISNGLSTMGYALPAAIGAALLDPSRPTVALTGDGGLLMCLGELRTAARENLPLRIIVFDDNVLSLIKIKQIKRGYRTDGVTIGAMNWAAIANSMGVLGRSASTEGELRTCLQETAEHPGPVLIAAKVSVDTYPETMRALRG